MLTTIFKRSKVEISEIRHNGAKLLVYNVDKGAVMPDIQYMIGKKVEVFANGIIYSGELIEVSDVEVYLKGSMQWLSLPASAVSEIRLAESE